jgi:hypothetical protein
VEWHILPHATLTLAPPGLEARFSSRFSTADPITHALVLATMGGITGAVEVTPENAHVQLRDARHRYEERLAKP